MYINAAVYHSMSYDGLTLGEEALTIKAIRGGH